MFFDSFDMDYKAFCDYICVWMCVFVAGRPALCNLARYTASVTINNKEI